MNDDNRKNYRKLSLESMLFSAIGIIMLIIVCGVPGGAVRYMAREVYQVIMAIAGIIFAIGAIGLLVTAKKSEDDES